MTEPDGLLIHKLESAVDLRFQARGLQVHRTMHNLVCRDDAGHYRAQVASRRGKGEGLPVPAPDMTTG